MALGWLVYVYDKLDKHFPFYLVVINYVNFLPYGLQFALITQNISKNTIIATVKLPFVHINTKNVSANESG